MFITGKKNRCEPNTGSAMYNDAYVLSVVQEPCIGCGSFKTWPPNYTLLIERCCLGSHLLG